MSASSGLTGECSVCSHYYNEHNRFRCEGSDKKKASKGKYKYEKCKTWWYICQQGSHEFAGDRVNAYMVCHGCSAHPGGGPDGTGPDGDYYTPSGGSGGSGGSGNQQQTEWLLDPKSQQYYYIDSEGKSQWAS